MECTGKNCGRIGTESHSKECILEHHESVNRTDLGEAVAWVCGDGEITESRPQAENWLFHGHGAFPLSERQHDQLKSLAVDWVKNNQR